MGDGRWAMGDDCDDGRRVTSATPVILGAAKDLLSRTGSRLGSEATPPTAHRPPPVARHQSPLS